MPGDSGVTCMLVCVLPLPLHTRPRAHRAPGIRCALCLEGGTKSNTRAKKIMRPAREVMSSRHCEDPLRQSNPLFACCIRGAMDCFAYARNDDFNCHRPGDDTFSH